MVRTVGNLRLAVIGTGRHGSRYARHAATDVDGVELVALCRRSETDGRGLADELGCRYTADAHELTRSADIDALAFVLPPYLLPDLVPAAAATGKRLIIEKPVAPTLAAGRKILGAIEDAGVYCMAGHTLRFNAVCRAMRDLVPELGRIHSVVMSQRFPPPARVDWLDDPARSGGGNILHTGVHCFDLIRFLTGLEPAAVTCQSTSVVTVNTEDNFTSTIALGDNGSSGALAMVTCSRTAACYNGLVEISGEHGQLVGDHVTGMLYRLGPGGRQDLQTAGPVYTVKAALERFVADWRNGIEQPPVNYRDGLAAVAVADACYRAAASGHREEVARL